MRHLKFLALIPALLLCAAPTLSEAGVNLNFSVSVAPPVLPVYVQPPLPAPGYIWTPGYWAWGGTDYYWVPGTWVLPPASDVLWTPGYWSWRNGFYGWSPGYWGPVVGFYGGVNYGFGYTGVGFQGGYWHGGAFFYNRAVANFGRTRVVNIYNTPIPRHERSRISFNGGEGGLRMQPDAMQRRALSERRDGPTVLQRQHEERAQSMPAMHAARNGGRPQILTTQRPTDFAHPGPGLHNHQQPRHQQPRIEGGSPQVRGQPFQRAPREQAPRGPAMREQAPREQAPRGQAPREQRPNPQGPREGQHQQDRREPGPQHDR